MRLLLVAFFAALFTFSVAGGALACPYHDKEKTETEAEDTKTS